MPSRLQKQKLADEKAVADPLTRRLRQKQRPADVKVAEAEASLESNRICKATIPEHNASLGPEALAGRILASGEVYFPMMTQNELAAITVPASAPADQVSLVLAKHGVCLVTGILSENECLDFERFWQADLLSVLDSTREDNISNATAKRLREEGIGTWPEAWSANLGKKGMVSQRALPHGAFAWNSRLHTEVRKVFANIFSTPAEDLAVGLDCVFWSAADSAAAESNNEWLHCDQNHRTGMTWPCVQGVLYVWPSESEKSSTTVVWPGSHRDVYRCIMDDMTAYSRGRVAGGQGIHLHSLADPQLRENITSKAVAGSRRVPCPAGSLLLWDSRTIHQGWAGGPRLAQPVCWEPRQRREQDPDALSRKMLMCLTGVPSSHSSAEARAHGMAPRSRNCELLPSAGYPGMRRQILPHCIDEEERLAWEAAQSSLWGARKGVNQTYVDALSFLLKPEVAAAL